MALWTAGRVDCPNKILNTHNIRNRTTIFYNYLYEEFKVPEMIKRIATPRLLKMQSAPPLRVSTTLEVLKIVLASIN